jgi:hypothetical protein
MMRLSIKTLESLGIARVEYEGVNYFIHTKWLTLPWILFRFCLILLMRKWGNR